MSKRLRSGNLYPAKQWSDAEAVEILKRFEATLDAIPEIREGCAYFFGISIPTTEKSPENGQALMRTAYFLTGHPHTAVLVGNGMASVYPLLLSEMSAFLARLTLAPIVREIAGDIEKEGAETLVPFPPVPDQKPS